jgi:hypothetical protein
LTDLVHETTQDLPKLMLSQIKKGRCLGLDDTQVKLIMPKDLPDKAEGIEDPQIKRLIKARNASMSVGSNLSRFG